MSSDYDASQIRAMTPREAVRLRPAMYLGDKDENGLHQLIYELLDNSIDEVVEGFGKKIKLTIHSDNSVTITDEGRGIPVEVDPAKNLPIAELTMTSLMYKWKLDINIYKVTGGLHGIGAACVNFLSEWLYLEIRRDGKIYQQTYQTGIPVKKLSITGSTNKTGTSIHFKPDSTIFTTAEFNFDRLELRLKQKVFLNSGLEIILVDEHENNSKAVRLYSQNGLADYVNFICQENSKVNHLPIHLIGKIQDSDLSIQVALLYTHQEVEKTYSFANQLPMQDGGTHLSGFYAGLTRAINQYSKSNHHKLALPANKLRSGLISVLTVTLPQPEFEGSIKARLHSDIGGLVQSFVYRNLMNYFASNPEVADKIINHLWQEN